MRQASRSILLLGFSTSVALLASEVLLRAATALPVTTDSNRQPDSLLVYRLDPRGRDVDARGFRNPTALREADIVVIGDSHTYGNNVAWEASWPAQLAALTGRRVYGMGVGGFGIYQHAALMEIAAELAARDIVIALYVPNDLHGPSGCRVLLQPSWVAMRERFGLELPSDCTEAPPVDVGLGRRVYAWTWSRSAIVNLIDLVWRRRGPTFDVGGARVDRSLVEEHRRAMDTSTEAGSAHHRNSEDLFRWMADFADGRGIRLTVLFVPSKERALAGRATAIPTDVRTVVEVETRLIDRYRLLFDSLGIGHADAAPEVVRVLTPDTYPVHDGHPLASGYAAYARAALALVAR